MYYITYRRAKGGTFVRKFKTLDELVKFEHDHLLHDSNFKRATNLKKYLTPYQYKVYKAKKDSMNRKIRVDNVTTISWIRSIGGRS